MKLVLTLIFGLIAGVAWATSFTDMDNARQITNELRNLQSTRDVQANQVQSVTIVAQVQPAQGPGLTYTFKPADTGWNAFLSGMNTMVGNKITALKSQLTALGVTNVPN